MLSNSDRTILRDTARQLAEFAVSPAMQERRELWRRLNSLERVRPLVCIQGGTAGDDPNRPVPRCEDAWARGLEADMLNRMYHHKSMGDDVLVNPTIRTPIVMEWGDPEVRGSTTRPEEAGGASHFNSVLDGNSSPEIWKMPVVTYDAKTSKANWEKVANILGDVVPVVQDKVWFHWFAPVDQFITLRGLEETMMDMIDRPDFVHAWIKRLTDYQIDQLEQLEKLGLLDLNNGANYVGPGGMGVTDELPQGGFDGKVRAKDQWSHAATQIFSEVSPAMHAEFAVPYERRYLEQFGLASYGCCEPLHKKVDILRCIPNLRRISMSPWVDSAIGAEAIGKDYIFSFKPNPSYLAMDRWDEAPARAQLEKALQDTQRRGCVTEVILKDLQTIRGDSRRILEWARMAIELSHKYAD